MHNLDKNEESKWLKPWPRSNLLTWIFALDHQMPPQSESTAVLLKYDE